MFDQLFTPIEIGKKSSRNRIVSSANFTGLAENNLPSERLAYYHAEKARGGVGITILEELPVSPTSRFSHARSIFAYDKRSVPGFKLLAEKIHEFGALTFGQLMHVGMNTSGLDPWGLEVKLTAGPSAIPSLAAPDGYTVSQEMSVSQIENEAKNYGLTATNLLEAGLDGVEIKCDAGALPMQFLSPLTNKRTDEYGGNFENRMRFLELAIDEIFAVTNGEKVLGMKLVGDEFVEGGLSKKEIQEIAKRIDSKGKVDYIAVASGNPGYDPDYNTPSAYYPQGVFVDLAANVREVVSRRLKVMTLGRIVEPKFAESLIASGKADLVIMMRALIADPELPRKAKEGRLSEIIPCIGCNQGCLNHVLTNRPTTCILNPTISRETKWGIGSIKPAEMSKTVTIVGAGPAGLECARIAASRSHNVSIYEQSDDIGGQARIASSLPPLRELSRAIAFWKAEMEKLKVQLFLNHRVTLQELKSKKPDVIVLATGVRAGQKFFSPAFPKLVGSEFLREANEICSYQKERNSGNSVTIYDDRGDIQALGWAELAADAGAKVTLMTRNSIVGQYVQDWTRHTANKRLLSKHVKFVTHVFLKNIGPSSVTYSNVYSNEDETVRSDATYFLAWPAADNDLYSTLREQKDVEVYAIGDCVSPRSIEEAVFEGHSIGRLI